MKARLTLIGLAAPALLVLAGIVYEPSARWLGRRRHPAPGQLIDVGGRRLHVRCEGAGAPTVVLEAGAANGSLSWYKVQPEIAKFTRVCAYDRGGHGWSDPGRRPRTPSVIAAELHALLAAARIPGPYVVVGHSLGGFYARTFATRYRDHVTALVLVESTHTDHFERLPPSMKGTGARRKLQHRIMGATVGVPRLFGWEFCGGGPAPIRDALRATECGPQFYRTLMDEMGGDIGTPEFDAAAREVEALGSLGTLPLTVVTADPQRPIPGVPSETEASHRKAVRIDMPQELAALSSNSRLVVARDSGHMVPYDRPDVIAEAVRSQIPGAQQ